jgi:hypothetical protein
LAAIGSIRAEPDSYGLDVEIIDQGEVQHLFQLVAMHLLRIQQRMQHPLQQGEGPLTSPAARKLILHGEAQACPLAEDNVDGTGEGGGSLARHIFTSEQPIPVARGSVTRVGHFTVQSDQALCATN